MFTLSNDTLSTLSGGMGVLVSLNSTYEQGAVFPANSSQFRNGSLELDSPTGLTALVRYLGEAIAEQRSQAQGEGFSGHRLGAITIYCFSFYGLMTFFISLILNRTMVIASSTPARRPLANAGNGYSSILRRMPISQDTMLKLLRFSAVVLLLAQVSNVLVVLNLMAKSSPELVSRLARLVPDYFQYDISLYYDDPYMKIPSNEVRFGPTSDMLWPLYLSVAYSIFVETFASAISNKQPLSGAGITLFELSLAIQEMSSEYSFLGGSGLSSRPTEPLLLVCLFALAEQISNQLGAVFYANKYRLLPSTLFSVTFLWYFVSELGSGRIISFPMEIMATYLCLCITIGIALVCFAIFLLALVTKGPRLYELNYSSFLEPGHEDYEFFSKHLNLDWGQDFYTAVINLAMVAVTSAGKSSYMTEYSILAGPEETWLETSAWNRVSKALDSTVLINDSRDVRGAKLSNYLRENGISGYGNVTNTPTRSMISGGETESYPSVPGFKVRYLYLKQTLSRFFQILVWPVVRIYNCLRFRQVQDEAQAAAFKKAQTPPFLRHLAEPTVVHTSAENSIQKAIDLNGVDDEDLEENYAIFLNGPDFLEDDKSPDYENWDSEMESDFDSDGEVIDLNAHPGLELITTENLLGLIQEKDVLEKHLSYENGIMTRSVFEACGQHQARDDMQKLLSLMVEKRQKQANDAHTDALVDDETPSFDHLACVVCQIEPREIITWPCKCFSICESCRLSLVSKGLEGCVCCRRDVEGVSRVYLP